MKNLTFISMLILAALPATASEDSSTPSLEPSKTFEKQTTSEKKEAKHPNGIAAIVNKDIITLDDIRLELAPIIPQIQRESLSLEAFNAQVEKIGREILENLIDRKLIVKEFDTKKMKIPQAYIDNEFADFLSNNFNGDRTQFLEFLKANGKTVREFRASLRENIIVSVMRQNKMKSQAEVSPERIVTYYNENPHKFVQKEGVKLRQITLTPYTDEPAELLVQQAEKILEDLNSGTQFSEVAQQYSQDDMKNSGGDWGWINRTDIREELANIAFSLDKGAFSEPIVIDNYVFILYVEDKREEGTQPLQEVRDEIEKTLSNEIAQQAQNKWIQRLRKKAHIQYFL